jgi:hypothetical protein
MNDTLKGTSRLWVLGFALFGSAVVAGCISDDSDPGEGDDNGTTGGSSGSGGSTGGSGGSKGGSSGTGGGGPVGTACESPITLAASTPGIADFDDYSGNADLTMWSFPLGGEMSTGILAGTFVYGDEASGYPETFEMVGGDDSPYALSISDTLAEEYGGGLGIWISECLDATALSGISFSVRGNAPEGKAKVSILMQETTPSVPAKPADKIGTCAGIGTGDAPTCVHPNFSFPVTDTWTEIQVPWASFAGGMATGTPVSADGHNIWQIQYDIGLVWTADEAGVYSPTPAEYELVVDDITFY